MVIPKQPRSLPFHGDFRLKSWPTIADPEQHCLLFAACRPSRFFVTSVELTVTALGHAKKKHKTTSTAFLTRMIIKEGVYQKGEGNERNR